MKQKNQLEIMFPEKGLDCKRKITVKKFLEHLVQEMCLRTCNYHQIHHIRDTRDPWHPLTYPERSMYALLASSAAAISQVVLSEFPAPRHEKKPRGDSRKGTPGRMDLWMSLKSGCDVILELKRR